MQTIRMEDMNWPDIEEAISHGFKTVVIGIGSNEQHGPHLPLKTDTAISDEIAFRVASKLENALMAPTIRVGCSEHHMTFPGTISLRASTLSAIIQDYVSSLQKHGFETIILLPFHGGNFIPAQKAISELREKYSDCRILGYTDLKSFVDAQFRIAAEFEITPEEGGAHGGEIETSMMMALAGGLVQKDRFAPGYLGPLGDNEIKIIMEKGMPSLSEVGVLGDPTNADAERGEQYLEKTADFLAKEIKKHL
jgi:creatinine amidohydrolase